VVHHGEARDLGIIPLFLPTVGREKNQSTPEAASPSPFIRLLASGERKRTE
jgi:hypothetical protein